MDEAERVGNHEVYLAACSCLADWLTVTCNTHWDNLEKDIPGIVQMYAEVIEVLENAAKQQAPRSMPETSPPPSLPPTPANTAPQPWGSVGPSKPTAVQSKPVHSAGPVGKAVSSSNPASSSTPSTSEVVEKELREYVEGWECSLEGQSVLPWESFSDLGRIKTEIETFITLSSMWIGRDPRLTGTGTILYGPGGTGKTSFVKSLAKQFDLPLFAIGPDHLKDKFCGNTDK